MTNGLVIRTTGGAYEVLGPDGTRETCRAKGAFRLQGLRTTNPVAVGDRVDTDGAYITTIRPRRNYMIRRASNLSKESHILGANLDRAMVVVTLKHPVTSTTFLDRFLATAEAYQVPVTIVVNKVDLLTDPDDREYLEAFTYLYESIGYDVRPVSAVTGQGINELCEELHDRVTLFSGNSGVGKSTLINALIPGLNLRTGAISEVHDRGMHTTTFSEMFHVPGGGWVIDTPGVKGFGTIDFDVAEVGHYFLEIFRISAGCKYGNCTHRHEPGCAVRTALDDHLVASSRYASYLSILDDAESATKYRS